jgi:hydroxymethylpyrimidine pyrophosphatase-like HAD family hydrolase
MTIYDVINGILFKKPVDKASIEELYVPFMTNRMLSFYDPSTVELANELNRLGHQFNDKQVGYNFFNTVIPKLKTKRIQYIKKEKAPTKKKADEEKEITIKLLANRFEISTREAKNYVDTLGALQ